MRFVLFVGWVVLLAAWPAAATTFQVTAQDFEFLPATLIIQQGDTVVWTNIQGAHNILHACGTALFGNAVAQAPWTYAFVFNLPAGDYPYLCEVHPDIMLGMITVQRPPQRWDVTVQSFFFTPQNLTVEQGDTVVWTNISGIHSVHHNATPSLFGNAIAAAPWTYTFVFDLPPATYPYICQQHPTTMQGSVTVQAPPSAPPAPQDLVIHAQAGGLATLTWNAVPGATCYTVYRSPAITGQPFAQLIGVTPDTTFVQPVTALPGLRYLFQVRALGN